MTKCKTASILESTVAKMFEQFNVLYTELVARLGSFLPEANRYVIMAEEVMKTDRRLPAHLFLSAVSDHCESILTKDESYFRDQFDLHPNNVVMRTISKHWHLLDDDQKDTVWFYLQEMIELLARCEEIRNTKELDAIAGGMVFKDVTSP